MNFLHGFISVFNSEGLGTVAAIGVLVYGTAAVIAVICWIAAKRITK